MATAAAPGRAPLPPENYLSCDYDWRSWLATKDHKRIALLFLPAIALMMAAAGMLGVTMRVELATPAADLLTPDTFNKLFTLHGMMMVWFVLMPAIPVTLANFVLPLMIGARGMAFPRLNRLALYLYAASAAAVLGVGLAGGIDTGWTLLVPYSIASRTLVTATLAALWINGVALLMIAVNQVATIHSMRAPGMTWLRLPVFAWASYAACAMMVIATPVLMVALLLLMLERALHLGPFSGPWGMLLFQQVFWFYGSPAVYIMALPAIGVVTEILSAMTGKRVYGYRALCASLLAIAVLAFTVWGRHMQVAGLSTSTALWLSFASNLIALPFFVILFSWMGTLFRGSVRFAAPLLWSLAAIGLVLIGGAAGLVLSNPAADRQLHATYFVTGHLHYVASGVLMVFFAGLHYWWPKITGRMYGEAAARVSAIVVFAGVNLTYFPYFLLGYAGLPRRYAAYPPEFQLPQVFSTAGTTILVIGYLIAVIGLISSLWHGKTADANPWQASGLEWSTASPPPPENFEHTPAAA